MFPTRIFEPEIHQIGGEPLAGSGFEADDLASGFESDNGLADEGFGQ